MKKAQINLLITLIILIAIFVITYIIFGIYLFSGDKSITGNVVNSNKEIVCNTPYIRIGEGCCVDSNDNQICDKDELELIGEIVQVPPGKYTSGTAIVTAPWYINAWNVKGGTSNSVTLELKNNGGEDYGLLEVSLDDDDNNCDDSSTVGWTVTAGSSQTVTVKCSDDLIEGDNFKADIKITYLERESNIKLFSTGTVAEIVSN